MKVKIIYGKPKRYFVDGKEVSEKRFHQLVPDKPLTGQCTVATLSMSSKAWPRRSDAFGTHPKKIAKARAEYSKAGVPTDFDPKTGQAIIRDNAHQRDLCKARGWVNYEAGYGQVTG